MFHAHQRSFAGPGHAQGLFVGDLLVGRPEGVNIARFLGRAIDELEDLGRGRSRIGVDAAHTGMNCAEANGLVAEQDLS